jgi:hypothetical protein
MIVSKRPDTLPELTLQRLSEIEALLTHESSVAFYSYRAHESMWLLLAEVRRLRAAVDAALALHQETTVLDEQVCGHCTFVTAAHKTVHLTAWPCATVRALAPVADPDPHTTSDEESTP